MFSEPIQSDRRYFRVAWVRNFLPLRKNDVSNWLKHGSYNTGMTFPGTKKGKNDLSQNNKFCSILNLKRLPIFLVREIVCAANRTWIRTPIRACRQPLSRVLVLIFFFFLCHSYLFFAPLLLHR
jgi:hypothetical protein